MPLRVWAAVWVIRSVGLMPVSDEKATVSAMVLLGTVATTLVVVLLTMALPSLTLRLKVVVLPCPATGWNTSDCSAVCAAPGAAGPRVG